MSSPSQRGDDDSVDLDRYSSGNNELLDIFNVDNVVENINVEVEEVSSNNNEDDMEVDANVELNSDFQYDDEENIDGDEAGPSSVPDDGDNDIEVVIGGEENRNVSSR
ncbi:hypothetical protein FRX31_019445 [Thalictrum thalictroides]|uniref:Uncharacterized protein n=1 Tax=Thalictrum thalictroides TaxID=46969 RepID=A0A7J6W2F1_THATH|nr:hypothetical protein FRX31_019445 [Thalictrum thalictroides]